MTVFVIFSIHFLTANLNIKKPLGFNELGRSQFI